MLLSPAARDNIVLCCLGNGGGWSQPPEMHVARCFLPLRGTTEPVPYYLGNVGGVEPARRDVRIARSFLPMRGTTEPLPCCLWNSGGA
ncbi:hypothetical protein NDU88_003169 [Pleurodeles waltl]|uniref:Uncharacterized protein n=1 Tax=Pleurodeles waltl TaxID=8319 RepID=A0AAV7MA91_PLEWA|nr:hypothetical protein NDU88_003169 [Pleurodeles waltl]